MPFTNFNDVQKRQDGGENHDERILRASGPLTLPWPRDQVEGPLTIRILMIQDSEGLGGRAPAKVDWSDTYAIPDPLPDNAEWRVDIPDVDDIPAAKYRIIGQVLIVRHNPDDGVHTNDPPVFENLTWCVSRDVLP